MQAHTWELVNALGFVKSVPVALFGSSNGGSISLLAQKMRWMLLSQYPVSLGVKAERSVTFDEHS